MKISKITITNFRSIQSASFEVDEFNIFVGQNNHGKTNFFEAINWFYNGKGDIDKIRYGRTGDAEVSVEIEFTEIRDGIDKMRNEKNKAAIEKILGTYETVRVKRSSSAPKIRSIFDTAKGGWLEKNPTGFDAAFNDFLPRFEYVSTQINPMDLAKYGKNSPITNMLSGVLSVILEGNPEYAAFKDKFEELFTSGDSRVRVELDALSLQVKIHLEKQFPDCTKVVFEVTPPIFEDLLKNFDTSIDDGVYTDASEKGDGMQRALMLAIIQTYANFRREQEEASKYFLFFIDEGELHLHPSAQRNLKNALLELSRGGDQVFINTHSSVLVVDDHENQEIFKVEKINKITSIEPIIEAEKPSIVYELLGGSPADLLLPRNFLILEGKSELEFLARVIERHYPTNTKVQLIPADGDFAQARRSFSAVAAMFKPLAESIYSDKAVLYVDQQNNRQQIDTFIAAHPEMLTNGQIRECSAASLEEYYPQTWRKTAAEVQAMSGEEKITLARTAGDAITREDFETIMPDLFNAYSRAREIAYG